MISDSHLHTRLSADADQSDENNLESFYAAAKAKKLRYFAVTEHCDILTGSEGYVNADLEKYSEEASRLKGAISSDGGSRTVFGYGIELAHAHRCPDEAKEILREHEYDFVLGSAHILRDETDFWGMDYSRYTDSELFEMYSRYVDEIYEISEACDFDSLAHCTYPLRYCARNGRLPEVCKSPSVFFPKYENILLNLISRKKAIEINTSDILSGGTFFPSEDIIRLYAKLGGKLVTLGSDSHDFRKVGSGVEQAEILLKQLGFEGVTVYFKRTAHILKWD